MRLIARPDRDRPEPFDGESDEQRLTSVYPGWRRAGRRRLRRWLVNELHDVQMISEAASRVYYHVTGGRVSYPHTVASAVIAEADDLHPEEIDGVAWCVEHDSCWIEGEVNCAGRPTSPVDDDSDECIEALLFHGPAIEPPRRPTAGEKIRATHAAHVARYDR